MLDKFLGVPVTANYQRLFMSVHLGRTKCCVEQIIQMIWIKLGKIIWNFKAFCKLKMSKVCIFQKEAPNSILKTVSHTVRFVEMAW